MAKKAAAKAAPAAKPAEKPAAPAPKAPAPKSATKAEIFAALAEKTGVSKKHVVSVFDALGELVAKELGKKGPGVFVVPGLLKLRVVRKPATKAKQGINPFTKEPMTIKAKPARNVVKAVPMKCLKSWSELLPRPDPDRSRVGPISHRQKPAIPSPHPFICPTSNSPVAN